VLGRVQLNQEPVDWKTVDVDYFRDTKQYKQDYMKLVKNAVPSPGIREALQQVKSTNTRLQYTSQQHFAVLAKSLHLMPDEKAGVPRTAYKGIVETRPNGEHFLFLVPKKKKRKHVV
jgi:alpha-1,3-mannosyl-glycoprotein beta-1,2-N-acetylglucosaminyltransferase